MCMLFRCLTLAILPHLCGGCGLVWLPRIEQPPGAVREVQVHDAATGEPIPDASIAYYVLPFRSDIGEFTARVASGVPGPPAPVPPRRSGAQHLLFIPPAIDTQHPGSGLKPSAVTRLGVKKVSEGRFRVRGRTLLGCSQLWWPLMYPRHSWTIDHGHVSAVVATAPGYEWQNVSYSPVLPRWEIREDLDLSSRGTRSMLTSDGVLVLYLDRLGPR